MIEKTVAVDRAGRPIGTITSIPGSGAYVDLKKWMEHSGRFPSTAEAQEHIKERASAGDLVWVDPDTFCWLRGLRGVVASEEAKRHPCWLRIASELEELGIVDLAKELRGLFL